jgi:hypothetical protein
VGESALDGALREAREETGIDTAALEPRFAVELDLGVWSYTTVAATAPAELAVHVADPESVELAWVPAAEVEQRRLHPGFGSAWPRLAELLAPRDALVVDAANVVGSRPDGWWRDRAGAAERLLAGLEALAATGMQVDDEGALPVVRRWPEVIAVLEGEARAARHDGGVTVARAARDGDGAIVGETERLVAAGRRTTVVTADRGLAERVVAAGGVVLAPGRLRALLP